VGQKSGCSPHARALAQSPVSLATSALSYLLPRRMIIVAITFGRRVHRLRRLDALQGGQKKVTSGIEGNGLIWVCPLSRVIIRIAQYVSLIPPDFWKTCSYRLPKVVTCMAYAKILTLAKNPLRAILAPVTAIPRPTIGFPVLATCLHCSVLK
jgi:hypothetical protein